MKFLKYIVNMPKMNLNVVVSQKKYAMSLGYTEEDISGENIPIGNLSCDNPVGLAGLKEGETVMDLGCGKGFDCRLSSKK